MTDDIYDKAKNYAYRVLGYRARSEKELRNKILEKGYSRKATNSVIAELKREGLINDKKFGQHWIKTRLENNARSLLVIKRELLLKGIDKEIVESLLDDFNQDFDEEKVVRRLIDSRMRVVRGLDPEKVKHRLYGFLKRRGFSSQIILKILSDVLNETC